jgi:hypothetical protein
MINLTLLADGRYVLDVGKGCVLVLTKAELIQGLKRGKWLRRAQAKAARISEVKEKSCPTLGSSPDH